MVVRPSARAFGDESTLGDGSFRRRPNSVMAETREWGATRSPWHLIAVVNLGSAETCGRLRKHTGAGQRNTTFHGGMGR